MTGDSLGRRSIHGIDLPEGLPPGMVLQLPREKVHLYVAFFSLGYTVKVAGSRVRSEDVGKTECILQDRISSEFMNCRVVLNPDWELTELTRGHP